ncbi:DMT family transporter [Variovorax ureilyticus]|uniref:DMT family transporter n=1 Tax=Variovorax ureilyticus TaxID=1836198 RepID=A0ABU8VEF8_9BURK
MTSSPNHRAFFSDRKVVFLFASLCCLLWGSAFPAIKNGYVLFQIAPDDIPSQLLFAGYRFLFAGLVLLVVAAFSRKAIFGFDRRSLGQMTLLGLTQTSLQYLFFYLGLAHTTGVKSSIMNATGTFFSVLLAHFIYHNDRLSFNKVLGCVVGFVGVMVVNFGRGAMEFDFTLLGEGSVVLAALVLSAASIYGKKLSQRIDSVVLTGYQLAIGGATLLLIGFALGGALREPTLGGLVLLGYLVVLSSAAFSLWTTLLKYNRVSMVTVFNFMVPIFGTLLSALFLDERFLEWKNALALLLVCAGIWLVTREEVPGARASLNPR